MLLIYRLGLSLYKLAARIVAPFSSKVKLWLQGQQHFNQFPEQPKSQQLVWIHCASLGEFEQGRPVIKQLRATYPNFKLLLSFFSPSGFEIRKDYNEADYITYLPLDSPKKAKAFIDKFNPDLAIFVKYEFWYFYSEYLNQLNVPLINISTILKPQQLSSGLSSQMTAKTLQFYSHFFVQNEQTKSLLADIGISDTTLAGDTRFDRVFNITETAGEFPDIKNFINGQLCVVAGSVWQQDIEHLNKIANLHPQIKFIIAPHEIDKNQIQNWQSELNETSSRYSDKQIKNNDQVLFIDSIGLLSQLYQFADIAYVGGAFGKGLHNILEAATFGCPIIFGPKYEKFDEAVELVKLGAAFSVKNLDQLNSQFETLIANSDLRLECKKTCKANVESNLGATRKIIDYCKTIL